MTTPDSQRVVPADLLPCPFCNAEPAYFSGTDIQYGHGESSDYAGVRCSVCRVEISFCNYAGYQLTERMALAAEKWNRRAASPPVAPPAAAQEGVSCWRLITREGAQPWVDGAVPAFDDDQAKSLGWSVELAYSHPPAQTQGAAKPAAWLHQVVGDDGEQDQALSFSPDNFPLEGVAGYRSLSHAPLYLGTPDSSEDRRDAERYRWLRRKVSAHGVIDGWAFGFPTHLSLPAPIEAMRDPSGALDAAIDAAREG